MKYIKKYNDFSSINESILHDEFDILILKDINVDLKKGNIVTIKEIIDSHIFITLDEISFSIKNFPEYEYWKEIEDEDIEYVNSTLSKMKIKY